MAILWYPSDFEILSDVDYNAIHSDENSEI